MPVAKDIFAQFMYMKVLQSASNTLTFAELAIGVSIFDYAALLLERIEYVPARGTLGDIVADSDIFTGAICGTDGITSLDMDQPEVYDRISFTAAAAGTAGNAIPYELPVVHDFTKLSGGGILVPAQNIYLAAESAGLAAAGQLEARVYYTIRELKPVDYIELVQRLRVLST